MEIITIYVLPIFTLILSFVFFWIAWNSSKKAEMLLKQVSEATNTWQNDIMRYASSILNSDPKLMGHKLYTARIKSAEELNPIIEKLSNNLLDKTLSEDEKESIRKDIKMFLEYKELYMFTGVPPIKKENKVDNNQ